MGWKWSGKIAFPNAKGEGENPRPRSRPSLISSSHDKARAMETIPILMAAARKSETCPTTSGGRSIWETHYIYSARSSRKRSGNDRGCLTMNEPVVGSQ